MLAYDAKAMINLDLNNFCQVVGEINGKRRMHMKPTSM
jgi:hypothetical protein